MELIYGAIKKLQCQAPLYARVVFFNLVPLPLLVFGLVFCELAQGGDLFLHIHIHLVNNTHQGGLPGYTISTRAYTYQGGVYYTHIGVRVHPGDEMLPIKTAYRFQDGASDVSYNVGVYRMEAGATTHLCTVHVEGRSNWCKKADGRVNYKEWCLNGSPQMRVLYSKDNLGAREACCTLTFTKDDFRADKDVYNILAKAILTIGLAGCP